MPRKAAGTAGGRGRQREAAGAAGGGKIQPFMRAVREQRRGKSASFLYYRKSLHKNYTKTVVFNYCHLNAALHMNTSYPAVLKTHGDLLSFLLFCSR